MEETIIKTQQSIKININNDIDERLGWTRLELGDVATYLNGRAFKQEEWKEYGLPIIRFQNLNNKNASYNYSVKIFKERNLVKQEELLFVCSVS